jgi:hypothetical protein
MKAWNLFQKKDFTAAANILDGILAELEDDKPSIRLLEVCRKWEADPSLAGDDFDITKMTEKS